MKPFRVPRLFYDDHISRAAYEGCHDVQNVGALWADLLMDETARAALLSDARWYADRRNHDTLWPGLVSSAKETMKRLA
jgi:hypothetical protein